MVGSTAGGTTGIGGSTSACCTLSSECNACLRKDPELSVPLCENLTGNDPIFATPNKDLCKAVLDCVIQTKCFDYQVLWSASSCYCGPDQTNCFVKGGANGACRQQIETGLDTEDPATVVLNFTNPDYPAGVALNAIKYATNRCTDECTDFISPDYYNQFGSGGSSGTGGAAGTGGVTGIGGTSTSSGGAPNSGGTTGTGTGTGTSVSGCPVSDSDHILCDFKDGAECLGVYKPGTTGSLGLTYPPDGGVPEYTDPNKDGGAGPEEVVSWDGNVGSPNLGSVLLNVPFNSTFQTLSLIDALSVPADFTGKTLFACVRLDSGLYPSGAAADVSGTTCAYVRIGASDATTGSLSTGSSVYICPGDAGQWIQVTYRPITTVSSTSGAVTFDATQISTIQVKISDGSWSSSTSIPESAALHVDSIGYR